MTSYLDFSTNKNKKNIGLGTLNNGKKKIKPVNINNN